MLLYIHISLKNMFRLDDARKSTVSHMVTCDRNDTCTTQKRKDLIESTSVVPAEYPPKVKLELLTTLEC